MDDLAFIIIIVLLVVIIIYFIVLIENPNNPPTPTPVVITPSYGGCAGTQYGCCPNSTVAKHDYIGSNCSSFNPIIIKPPSPYHPPPPPPPHPPLPPPPPPQPYQTPCIKSKFGCCPYSNISKEDDVGSNCLSNKIGGCSGTQYGCCPDGVTAKDKHGLCYY
jgi:hypothetical protein